MATKSTNSKYSGAAKAVCLVLSLLLFAAGTFLSVRLGEDCAVFGTDRFLRGGTHVSYTDTPLFERLLTEDLSNMEYVASVNASSYRKQLAKAQEETVEEIVDQYMARQRFLLQQKQDPEEENFGRDPQVEDLGTVSFYYENMALSEDAIRKVLNEQYDEWEKEKLDEYQYDWEAVTGWLNGSTSLHYYIRGEDGSVYSSEGNVAAVDHKDPAKVLPKPAVAEVKQHSIYALRSATRNEAENIPFWGTVSLGLPEKAFVYVYMEDYLAGETLEDSGSANYKDDGYYASYRLYQKALRDNAKVLIPALVLCYLLGLVLLLLFLKKVGHVSVSPVGDAPVRTAPDGSFLTTAPVDKLPGDVHAFLSAVLFGVCMGIPLAAMTESTSELPLWHWYPWGGAAVTAVCMLILAEWLASVCRTVKSGYGFWKHTWLVRFCKWLWRLCKRLWNRCKEAWHLTQYEPGHLKKQTFWMFTGFLLLNFLLVALLAVSMVQGSAPVFVLVLAAILAFNIYVLRKGLKNLQTLDRIMEVATDDAGPEAAAALQESLADSETPASLQTLAGNLALTRERVDAAVAKAVREEQTRTELITNVTHDLKTPLTSLINYSDLLQNSAEHGSLDTDTRSYIEVIHDQSEKLKHLIEDLLEASKASAGNVQLNCTTLNLTELAAQAIAEFAPEMAKNGNEVLFLDGNGTAAAAEHKVYADGTKTYRILANLLSNAKKYSAPGTRIYATVSGPERLENGSAVTRLELKNVSAAPLNISPEELMERFVRGDRSRGETEGNGLGLSIARDLASLMGGAVTLAIDGDLFKAVVTLPAERP